MVNSCNSYSPILLDTPERHHGSPNGTIIEISDSNSGGLSRTHLTRRRRLDSSDDIIVTDSPKRPRIDVIDLTSDNDEDVSVTENATDRVFLSMPEPPRSRQSYTDEMRNRLRRVLTRMSNPALSQPRFDSLYSNISNDDILGAESTGNQPLSRSPSEEHPRMPIVVDDDEGNNSPTLLYDEEEFTLPSCSRVNPSRVYLPDTPASAFPPPPLTGGATGGTAGGVTNSRDSGHGSRDGRSQRSRTPAHHSNTADQATTSGERSFAGSSRNPLNVSRSRHVQRRRQHLRDCVAYHPRSRHSGNFQNNFAVNQATGIQTQSSSYQGTGSSNAFRNETLNRNIPGDVETQPAPRRFAAQPLQPYIPELLIPAVLSIWNPDNLRHLEPEEEREDYEALWNLTERLGPVKPKGLTKADMEEIPAFRFSAASRDSSNGSCVVCMMNYSNREKLRRLPCNHDFHAKCIDRWFKASQRALGRGHMIGVT